MPTTIDRFFAVVQICQNLATMQNNMRANVTALKASHDAPNPGGPVTTVGPDGYTAGSGRLVVVNHLRIAEGALIELDTPLHSVLRVLSKVGNTLTVSAKHNDGNAASGAAIALVSNLFEDFPATQQAVRDLGRAFLQRLDMNAAVVSQFRVQVQAGAEALGIVYTDMTDIYNLLRTWATNLNTATITNQTQLDNGVAAILANVPAAMLPF